MWLFLLHQNALDTLPMNYYMNQEKKDMTASNLADQESENNTLFSHSKQLFCTTTDSANSCLIICCHSQRHGQQTEFGDIQISCTVKPRRYLLLHSLQDPQPTLAAEIDEE